MKRKNEEDIYLRFTGKNEGKAEEIIIPIQRTDSTNEVKKRRSRKWRVRIAEQEQD